MNWSSIPLRGALPLRDDMQLNMDCIVRSHEGSKSFYIEGRCDKRKLYFVSKMQPDEDERIYEVPFLPPDELGQPDYTESESECDSDEPELWCKVDMDDPTVLMNTAHPLAVSPLSRGHELGDIVEVTLLSGEQQKVRLVGTVPDGSKWFVRKYKSQDMRLFEISVAR